LISGGQTCPAFLQLVDLYWFHAHFLQTKVLLSCMGHPAVNKGQGLKSIHVINLSYASFSGKSPVHSKKKNLPWGGLGFGWYDVDQSVHLLVINQPFHAMSIGTTRETHLSNSVILR
jgi:hypothetical protein